MFRALPAILLTLTTAAAVFAAQAAEKGAKGMFYEQLGRPTEKLNNGIQYWIELKRAGKSTAVSNKFPFRSGDQIRFHVKSNMDGFAYVVLREGSQGESALLFPDSRHADDNRMNARTEYAIPADDFLLFDKNPGTEKLTLVLTRQPIEPKKFSPDNFKDRVVVASRIDGSKDLVPGSFVVSYGNSPPANLPVQSPKPGDNTVVPSGTVPGISTPGSPPLKDEDSGAIITVVQKNPADALAIDIFLEHVR